MTPEPVASAAARLEFNLLGGPLLGDGVQESDTRLRVDLGTRAVFFERHQPGSDSGGESIGTYRFEAPAEVLGRLHDALATVAFETLPAAGGGGMGMTSLELRVTEGERVRWIVFTQRDVELGKRLEPVVSILEEIMRLALDHPLQAIELTVENTQAAPVLVLKNVGSERLALRDPRSLAGPYNDGLAWAGIRYAVAAKPVPGVTPLPPNWQYAALVPGSSSAVAPLLVLAPGASQRFAAHRQPHVAGRRYLLQATYSCYSGEPVRDGVPVVRGRLFSEAILVTR